MFFQKFACSAENLAKVVANTVLWESSKNQFGQPKKKVVKFLEIFLKIRPPPPPRENPRSAPATNYPVLKSADDLKMCSNKLLTSKLIGFCNILLTNIGSLGLYFQLKQVK